jgi:hypothetical protein
MNKHGKGTAAVLLRAEGYSIRELSEIFNQQESSVRRLIAEAKDRGVKPSGKPTLLWIPDPQIAPGQNLDHMLWAGRYAAERKPDYIVCAGDLYDMPSLSSYDSRGSKMMEGKRYKEDISAGNKGVELFSAGLDGYTPPLGQEFLLGNHEERIDRAINTDPGKLEGVIGYHDFNLEANGWRVHPYLQPIEVGGVWMAHYFYNLNTGRSYSGAVDTMLRHVGASFAMGHQQGLRWSRREINNGKAQIGLVAGSYYQEPQNYRGLQGTHEWCGLVFMFELEDGQYDPMMVSIDYLKRRFGDQ